MTKTAFGLVLFFWIALHTSQSFIDLADFLVILAAFWIALKSQDLLKLTTSFKPAWLWPVWIAVIALGFVFGAPIETKTALKLIWEFRWFVSVFCYIYLFRKITWNELQIKSMAGALLAFGILDLVLFFVNYDKDPRAGGLFGHSMPFAHSMGPAALFLLFIGIKKSLEVKQNTLSRVIYAGGPLLASLLVVLSLTRGVWLGFGISLLVCALFLGRKVFLSAILSMALVGGIFFMGSEKVQNRVMTKTRAESQSNNERMEYWKANFKIFQDYPVFGIGYSQNNVHVEEYLKKSGVKWLTGSAHAHNQYIQFLAGTGILGLTCFLIFLGGVFYPITKALLVLKKQHSRSDQYFLLVGVFAALLCFTLGALTESNFSIAKNRFMFLFIAAIGYALSYKKKA